MGEVLERCIKIYKLKMPLFNLICGNVRIKSLGFFRTYIIPSFGPL